MSEVILCTERVNYPHSADSYTRLTVAYTQHTLNLDILNLLMSGDTAARHNNNLEKIQFICSFS